MQSTHPTAIIGAGVIGLATAYQLAFGQQASGKMQPIIVIDINDSAFNRASNSNSGCLIPTEMRPQLRQLAEYSYSLYLGLQENDHDFSLKTGFRERSLVAVEKGSGNDLNILPDWLKSDCSWDAQFEPPDGHSALINPIALGEWLLSRCEDMGVRIETSTDVRAVEVSKDSQVRSLTYFNRTNGTVTIPVQNVVLTAGPWTAGLISRLFPDSPIDLGSRPNAGDYIIFKNPKQTSEASLSSVFLDPIVGHKLEFCARNDGTIWVCAQANESAVLPDPKLNQEPDPEMIDEMINYINRFIDFSGEPHGERPQAIRIVGQGRAFRPSTRSGLPIIAAVPCDKLRGGTSSGSSERSGVFICSGHGSYGVVLGMGSARLMAQLIQGEEPEMDISDFDLGCTNDMHI